MSAHVTRLGSRAHVSQVASNVAHTYGAAAEPVWWDGYSLVTQAVIDEIDTAFGGAALTPPTPPTIDPLNDVEVVNATELHAVTDSDGESIETHVHITASFSAVDARINTSDVLVTTAPGIVLSTTPAFHTAALSSTVTRCEWDGGGGSSGDYPLAMRCQITEGVGGNNSYVPTHIVVRRCNIYRSAGNPCIDRIMSNSAIADCRLYAPWGVLSYAPATSLVMTDFYVLNCTMQADNLGGTDRVIELAHADDATELTRLVLWNIHSESDGTSDELYLARCSDVAFLDSVLRVETITHDTGIGSGIYYWRMLDYSGSTPTGTATPAYWEWKDSTSGIASATFTTAMGTPDVFTGNTWSGSTTAPDWELPSGTNTAAPGDPALVLGLGHTTALDTDLLHLWMVPPTDPVAGDSGPLITLNSGNVSQLDDFGGSGASNQAQATAGNQPAYVDEASAGAFGRAHVSLQGVGRNTMAAVSITGGARVGVYSVQATPASPAGTRYTTYMRDTGASNIVATGRGVSSGRYHQYDFTAGDQAFFITSPAASDAWFLDYMGAEAAGALSEIDGAVTTADLTGTEATLTLDESYIGAPSSSSLTNGLVACKALVTATDATKRAIVERFIKENYPTLTIA